MLSGEQTKRLSRRRTQQRGDRMDCEDPRARRRSPKLLLSMHSRLGRPTWFRLGYAFEMQHTAEPRLPHSARSHNARPVSNSHGKKRSCSILARFRVSERCRRRGLKSLFRLFMPHSTRSLYCIQRTKRPMWQGRPKNFVVLATWIRTRIS